MLERLLWSLLAASIVYLLYVAALWMGMKWATRGWDTFQERRFYFPRRGRRGAR